MGINKYLLDFLRDEVNIDQYRLDTAKQNIAGVSTAIEGSSIISGIVVGRPSPQGSYRHGTIIKPVNKDDEFDVDLMVEIKKPNNWGYADCLNNVFQVFKDHGVYKDKCYLKTRCVTIDYTGQNSIDIVPTFQELGEYFIINGEADRKEISDGEGFSNWFDKQNKQTNGNLKRVLRLVKYARNNRKIFDIRSIHLNILFGNTVNGGGDFSNLETTFTALVYNLQNYLSTIHSVGSLNLINPANPKENLGEGNRNLKDSELIKFKGFISDISGVLSSEMSSEDKLRELSKHFGTNITKGYFTECSKGFVYQGKDIITEKRLFGRRIIGKVILDNPTYKKLGKYQTHYTAILESGEPINSKVDLHFECKIDGITEDYEIFWQVVNSGSEAEIDKALRGDFFKGKKRLSDNTTTTNGPEYKNIEVTRYVGIHWVKCYVVKDNWLVAESDKFFVNIKRPSVN